MTDPMRDEILKAQDNNLKTLWETVLSWYSRARGDGGWIAPHKRKANRKIADKQLDKYDDAVENVLVSRIGFGIIDSITGPEEIDIKKRRPPPIDFRKAA